MKIKSILLTSFGILFLGSCGLLKAAFGNASFDLTVINEPNKPNSFGECKSLVIDLEGAQNSKLTINASDVQGKKVYSIPFTDGNGFTDITVTCDGNTEQLQTFYFPTDRVGEATLYRKSTAPDIFIDNPDFLPDEEIFTILPGSYKGPFILIKN